jgi:hypothetical protein
LKTVRFLAWGLRVALLSFWAFGLEAKIPDEILPIKLASFQPMPTALQMEFWQKNFFETCTILPFIDTETAISIIETSHLPLGLQGKLKNRLKPYLTLAEDIRFRSHLPRDKFVGAYLSLPHELYKKLSREFLEISYLHQYHALNISVLSINFEKPDEFFGELDQKAIDELKKNIFEFEGEAKLVVNPYVWRLFNSEMRRAIVDLYVNDGSDFKVGVNATLVMKNFKDAQRFAEMLAGWRDPKPIQRYLENFFNTHKKSRTAVKVPLQNILFPFIRKTINTFSTCHGPNCFNMGANVHKGNHFVQESLPYERLLMDVIYATYRLMAQKESLRAGDVMVYRDEDGGVSHVSVYIAPVKTANGRDDHLVYTKNGFNKFNPYMFQLRSKNEKIYFEDKKFQLMVFRIPTATSRSEDCGKLISAIAEI